MDITATFEPKTRAGWRSWLEANHKTAQEIWLLYVPQEKSAITYLDIVEEALCFGWVDGIAKKFDDTRSAQRLTPRRPKSSWTELNKERVRRLIAAGKMAPAGLAVAPDLSIESFSFSAELRRAFEAEPVAWKNFLAFPALYQRVRAGYVEDAKKTPAEYQKRLQNLLERSRKNEMFGNWDDAKMPRSEQ